MGNKRIYDVPQLNDLLWEHSHGSSDVNVAFGLRPSGIVHLGNLFTLALAGEIVNRIGPHISQLVLTVLDTELPFIQDWNFSKEGYVRHYRDLPCEGYDSFAQRANINLLHALESLNDEMRVPYLLRSLSDVQRNINFRRGLKNILDGEGDRKLLQENSNGRIEVFPLCQNCGTSYTNSMKGKVNRYDKGVIHTFCSNPKCPVKEYDFNVLDTSFDISVHPLMGALRDLVEPSVKIHVYGGDYASSHGESKESKVRKIQRVMDMASPLTNLDFFVGPTIFAKGRHKMSKSSHNGVDCNNLKRLFGDDYMKRVLDFTREIIDAEYSLVDFAIVQERFLR